MNLPDFHEIIESRALISMLSVISGALLGNLISTYRDRIKLIEYTVNHDRIGLSADDAIFGSVRITWQGYHLSNLYSSIVTIVNSTSTDYTNLKLKVYTGNTQLLNERTEISDTTYVLKWEEAFADSLRVPEGEQPTDQQLNIYRHTREYLLPVFNRGQRVVLHYLTTVPNGNEAPYVWVDLLHPSTKITFRPLQPEIHGVAVKSALPIGFISCLVLLVWIAVYVDQPWAAATIAMTAGLFAQSIGAAIYRVATILKRVLMP